MNQHIDEESIKQPNLRDIIRVYKVGSMSFGGGSATLDLSPLIKQIEDFVRDKGYASYLNHQFVTVPYEIFPRSGGLNSDIKSTISAYVTYKDRELT